jgi:hypothetical protein
MQEYRVTIDVNGTQRWYNKDNEHHREDDKPAIVYTDGTQIWMRNSKLHRDNGPAAIYADGTQLWCKNDELHRDNGKPAVINADGTEEYWLNDKRQPNPKEFKELTVAAIERILGYRIKIVK